MFVWRRASFPNGQAGDVPKYLESSSEYTLARSKRVFLNEKLTTASEWDQGAHCSLEDRRSFHSDGKARRADFRRRRMRKRRHRRRRDSSTRSSVRSRRGSWSVSFENRRYGGTAPNNLENSRSATKQDGPAPALVHRPTFGSRYVIPRPPTVSRRAFGGLRKNEENLSGVAEKPFTKVLLD